MGWKMQMWQPIKKPFIKHEGEKITNNKAFFKRR